MGNNSVSFIDRNGGIGERWRARRAARQNNGVFGQNNTGDWTAVWGNMDEGLTYTNFGQSGWSNFCNPTGGINWTSNIFGINGPARIGDFNVPSINIDDVLTNLNFRIAKLQNNIVQKVIDVTQSSFDMGQKIGDGIQSIFSDKDILQLDPNNVSPELNVIKEHEIIHIRIDMRGVDSIKTSENGDTTDVHYLWSNIWSNRPDSIQIRNGIKYKTKGF